MKIKTTILGKLIILVFAILFALLICFVVNHIWKEHIIAHFIHKPITFDLPINEDNRDLNELKQEFNTEIKKFDSMLQRGNNLYKKYNDSRIKSQIEKLVEYRQEILGKEFFYYKQVTEPITCPRCHGTGKVPGMLYGENDCPDCHGSGIKGNTTFFKIYTKKGEELEE